MYDSYSIDFAIITALSLEAKAITKRLNNRETKRFEKDDIRTYHYGTVPIDGTDESYKVVVVVLPTIGETDSAIAVTDTIVKWNPRFALLLGIAGGLPKDDLSLGDVIVAEQVIGYEYGKETDQGLQPRDRVYPASPLLLDRIRNFWDEGWVDNVGMKMPGRTRRKKPKLFAGSIASGNKVIASEEFRTALVKRWPKVIAVEMEAEGFYSAMHSRPQIAGALVVRGISDMADKAKSDLWQEYAANAAAAFVIGFLKSGPFDPIQTEKFEEANNSSLREMIAAVTDGRIDVRELASRAEKQGFGGQYMLMEEMIAYLFKKGYSLDYDPNNPTKVILGNSELSEAKIEQNQLNKLTEEISRLRQAITGHEPDESELADLEDRYRKHIIRWFERLTFQGMMRTAQVISLPLEELYIDLHAVAQVPEAADTFSVEERRLLLELKEGNEELRQELLRQFDALRKERWSQAKLERKSIIEALYSNERLAFVVLGDPGSGKSTLLRFLAVVFARGPQYVIGRLNLPETEANRLPIFIPLAAFDDMRRAQPGLTLHSFLGQFYDRRRGLPGLGSLFQNALEMGRALVLMDGLDEIIDPATRQYVAAQAAAMIDEYCPRGTRFVLTSRFVGYREAPVGRDLPHLSVIDFGDSDIKTFIHQWAYVYETFVSGGVETPEAIRRAREAENDLLKDVNSIESVRRLAANPLMLTMLALLRRQVGRLPHRRIELYQRYMATMLENWVQARTEGAHEHTLNLLDPHKAESLLIPLAYWLQSERPSGTASGKDIEEELVNIILFDEGINAMSASSTKQNEALAQSRKFLHEMRHMNGLIVERGYDAYGFLHLTFQEYFAGRALAKMEPAERQRVLTKKMHDPRWREPILLCAGQLGIIEKRRPQVTEFVRQIMNCSDETEADLHRNLLLSLSIACDDVNLDPILINELLKQGINCLPTRVYALASDIFIRLGQLVANQSINSEIYLSHLSKFEDSELLVVAIRAFSKFVTDHALYQFIIDRLDNKSSDVRIAAVTALASLVGSDETIRNAVLGKLEDKDSNVQGAVVKALAPLIGSDETIRNAVLRKPEDANWYARYIVVNALAPLVGSDETIRNAVLGKLEDEDSNVQGAVVNALAPLVGSDETIRNAVLGKLKDASWYVRYIVVEALAPLVGSDETIRNAVLGKLEDKASNVRRAVVNALAPLVGSDETIRNAVLDKLEDKDSDVQGAVVKALAPLVGSDETIRNAVLGKLEDEDSDVQGAVVKALAPLVGSDETIRNAIASCMESPNWMVRRTAVVVLSECLANPKLAPFLLPIIKRGSNNQTSLESDWYTRKIILALSKVINVKEVMESVRDKLENKSSHVRIAAVIALASLVGSDETIRNAVLGKLEDEDSDVQGAVVEALAPLIGSDETIRNAVLGKLEDEDSNVQGAVVKALAPLIGSDETIRNAVLGKLKDEDSNVQGAVVEALAPLVGSDETIRNAVLGKLKDASWYVRYIVVEALAPLVGSDETIRNAVLGKLEDEDSNVQGAVVNALAPLVGSDETIRNAVLGKLEDEDSNVQGAVVNALAPLVGSDETIRNAVLGKLEDASWYVRLFVFTAIFNSDEFISNLEFELQTKYKEWLFVDVAPELERPYVPFGVQNSRNTFSPITILVGEQLSKDTLLQTRVLEGLQNPRGSIRLGSALALLACSGGLPNDLLGHVLQSLNNSNELASYPARLEAANILINRDPYSADAVSLCMEALEYGTKPWEILPESGSIREQAARILGRLEMTAYDEKVYIKLKQVMYEDQSTDVRDEAYGALLRLARLRPICEDEFEKPDA